MRFDGHLFAGVLLLAGAVSATGAELGAHGCTPTPEQPMGWRGDGTGRYPGATPPARWFRRAVMGATAGASYQAKKPAGDAPSKDAAKLELGIVKDWLVLGPFASDNPAADIDKAFYPDEAALQPDDGTKTGALEWKALHTSIDTQSTHYTNEGTCGNFHIDFVQLFGKVNNQVAYAHTYLYSPTGGPFQFSMHRAGAAAKIWLNGQPTVLNPKDWASIHKSNQTLVKGWNRLLVKLSVAESTKPEGQNPWVSKWLFAPFFSAPLPTAYETQNIAWMTRLPGFSASSPVIVGDRLYATCGTCDLICINKKDGKVQWLTSATPVDAAGDAEKALPGFKDKAEPLNAELKAANDNLVKELNALNPLAGLPQDAQTKIDNLVKQKHELEKKLHDALKAADAKKYPQMYINEVSATNGTPVTDGKQVYLAAGGGSKGPGAYVVAAYTLDGQRVWSWHEALGAEEHGNHVTPALVDGKLIYGEGPRILAFDAQTGKVVWRDQSKAAGGYASLFVPAKIGGASVLIAQPNRILQLSDGKVLSELPNTRFFNGDPTPVLDGGMLYYNGERKDLCAVKLPDSPSGAFKPAWKLDGKQWRIEASSGFSIASSLIVNGILYNVDTMGGLTTVDLASSKVLYTRRLEMYQRANRQIFGYTASPTLGGKQLYIFDNTGCAVVLDPGPEYKEAAKNILENQIASTWMDYRQESFYASPVFDEASLYIKGSEYLYCVRGK
ncbi:MAG: PQQ-binding-like beta-propeller repeat protein [Planctomycetes bacterium]|nr:PQQ-binding-like beta-propeller repeat protein [Planctomycetota bacterium]